MNDQQRATALMATGYGFGAMGLAAPRAMSSTFGVNNVSDEYLALMRTFSLRNLALAQALRLVNDDDKLRKRFFTIAAAMFSADTVTALATASTGKIGWRTALTLAAVTATAAAIAASGAAAG